MTIFLSAISPCGTKPADRLSENFWLIVVTEGNEDETEIHGAEQDIQRQTRKQYSVEENIRIVLSGLRGEYSIAELCRREGIAESLYYRWSKEFLEAGKKRLSGDTARPSMIADGGDEE